MEIRKYMLRENGQSVSSLSLSLPFILQATARNYSDDKATVVNGLGHVRSGEKEVRPVCLFCTA